MRFEWCEPHGVRIVSINDAERHFLPLELEGTATDESLWAWLRRRTVPKHRHYIQSMLGNLGLSAEDTRSIIGLCKGLSLTDVHWVVPDGFQGKWCDFNLYANPFSKLLAAMAFTGSAPASPLPADISTSPEFTTNGSANYGSSQPLAVQIKENLEADPFITYVELSELLHVPPRTLARRIKELQSSGEIRRVGATKNGHWEVKPT